MSIGDYYSRLASHHTNELAKSTSAHFDKLAADMKSVFDDESLRYKAKERYSMGVSKGWHHGFEYMCESDSYRRGDGTVVTRQQLEDSMSTPKYDSRGLMIKPSGYADVLRDGLKDVFKDTFDNYPESLIGASRHNDSADAMGYAIKEMQKQIERQQAKTLEEAIYGGPHKVKPETASDLSQKALEDMLKEIERKFPDKPKTAPAKYVHKKVAVGFGLAPEQPPAPKSKVKVTTDGLGQMEFGASESWWTRLKRWWQS